MIRHLNSLARLPFASSCKLGIIIEGQTKAVSETIEIAISDYFQQFYPRTHEPSPFMETRGMHFYFINSYNKPNAEGNQFHYPNNDSRVRGMLALQKALETLSLRRHVDMFVDCDDASYGVMDTWKLLGTQFRNIRVTQPKGKITGKSDDEETGKDDIYMALSNVMEAMVVVPSWFITNSFAVMRAYKMQ